MKGETIYYKVPQSVRFNGKQMQAIYEAWKERWNTDKSADEMTEEDCLVEAIALGYVQLPEGWSAQ